MSRCSLYIVCDCLLVMYTSYFFLQFLLIIRHHDVLHFSSMHHRLQGVDGSLCLRRITRREDRRAQGRNKKPRIVLLLSMEP